MRGAIARLGGGTPVVRRCGVGVVEPPTIVVEIARMAAPPPAQGGPRSRPRRR